MKRFSLLVLAVVLLISMVGCGQKSDEGVLHSVTDGKTFDSGNSDIKLADVILGQNKAESEAEKRAETEAKKKARERAKEKEKQKKEKQKKELEDMKAFEKYLLENIDGTWFSDVANHTIRFTENYIITTYSDGDQDKDAIKRNPFTGSFFTVTIENGIPIAEIETDDIYIRIESTENTYTENCIEIYDCEFYKIGN